MTSLDPPHFSSDVKKSNRRTNIPLDRKTNRKTERQKERQGSNWSNIVNIGVT